MEKTGLQATGNRNCLVFATHKLGEDILNFLSIPQKRGGGG